MRLSGKLKDTKCSRNWKPVKLDLNKFMYEVHSCYSSEVLLSHWRMALTIVQTYNFGPFRVQSEIIWEEAELWPTTKINLTIERKNKQIFFLWNTDYQPRNHERDSHLFTNICVHGVTNWSTCRKMAPVKQGKKNS